VTGIRPYQSAADGMTTSAIVRGIAHDGAVEIEISGAVGCRGCEGTCTWRRMRPNTRMTITAVDTPVSVGDAVTVQLPAHSVLLGALLLYGTPLAGMLAGALLAGLAGGWSDLAVLAGAVAGTAVAVVAMPAAKRRLEAAMLRQLKLAGRS
jgi:sigma-E factor negative regulatory protein RseC